MIPKDIFIQKVIKIYKKAEEEDSGNTNKPKGPPARWKEFLKEKYESGKKKVTNTNPDTKDQFPQVTMLTLFNNDSQFKAKVMKEYESWLKDSKQTDLFYDSKPKTQDKPKQQVDFKLPFHNEALENRIQTLQKEYKQAFDSFKVTQEDINKGGLHLNSVLQKSLCRGLDKLLGKSKQYDHYIDFRDQWLDSSQESWSLKYSKYFKDMGVTGYDAPGDYDPTFLNLNEDRKNAILDIYAFQQAFFRSKGIKSITLYRGVQGKSNPEFANADWGTKTKIQTRTISSFSGSPLKAFNFTNFKLKKPCLVKFEVPVERIFLSATIEDDFRITPANPNNPYKEEEYIVLGASDLEGTKIGLKGAKQIPQGGFNQFHLNGVSLIDKPE
jgi:hypothetical protein